MKKNKLIPFLIVAFPAGLLLIGIGAVVNTSLKSGRDTRDPDEKVRLEAASLNQRAVSKEDLQRFLTILTEQIGERNYLKPKKLESAAIWLESTLGGGNMGYQIKRHEYAVDGQEYRNIVAELPGKERRSEIVVIGAHYDSYKGTPGANDNGTGVAALLAMAQALAGEQQDRTVRFVAFANEEPPFFQTENMGSRQYAALCQRANENIVAMMALDTIGYYSEEAGSQQFPEGEFGEIPDAGSFLAFVGKEGSRYTVDGARAIFMGVSETPALALAMPESVPGVAWSDHWSFWQEGYPGIMVTDTGPYRYPHYHKPTDTIDKLDMEKLESVVIGLEAVVRAWANPE